MSQFNVTGFDRRAVLRMLGLTSGAALLPSLTPRSAKAAVAPLRYLWFYTYHGTLPQFWVPKSGNETDWVSNDILAPLDAYKKDLVLLDGLDMKSWNVLNYGNAGNAHQQGQNHSVAGTNGQNADLAGGPSLDQLIAKENPGQGPPSIEMGIAGGGTSFPSYHGIAHTGPGKKIASEGDPRKVWNRLFGNFTPPAAGTPATPAPAPMPAADNSKKRLKSVLDQVRNEIAAVQPKLSSADRMKLEAHADAVRDLETRLQLTSMPSGGGGTTTPAGGAGAGCAALAQPTSTTFSAMVEATAKMAAMAFACDRTRVASINIDELPNSVSGYTSGAYGSADSHDLVHRTSPRNGDLRSNADANAMVKKYHLVYTNAFLAVLDALSKMPDVDGKRVLDNTVVLWSGEIAEGGHKLDDCKWLLAGSAGGKIRTGRWLKCNGAPHQNLYVSLGQAMGLNISTFGNPSTCTGKLAIL